MVNLASGIVSGRGPTADRPLLGLPSVILHRAKGGIGNDYIHRTRRNALGHGIALGHPVISLLEIRSSLCIDLIGLHQGRCRPQQQCAMACGGLVDRRGLINPRQLTSQKGDGHRRTVSLVLDAG